MDYLYRYIAQVEDAKARDALDYFLMELKELREKVERLEEKARQYDEKH